MPAPTPIETVTALCARLAEGPEAARAVFRECFTPATVWENVGLALTTGPDEAIAFLEQFEQSAGLHAIAIEMLAIAAMGNRVLTERIDRLVDASGKDIAALRLMGIFELTEDGRIAAWRDYFDTAALAPPAG